MNLLYICYWGISDGLTESTVLPHLEILAELDNIQKIIFCTIERDGLTINSNRRFKEKIKHIPLTSENIRPSFINKVFDFILFPKQLSKLVAQYSIDKVLARGAPAGALAWMIYRKQGIPYIVESFEPHADYMYESGVWSSINPKYIFELYWERKQKETAEYLITVSNNYREKLLSEGVSPNRVETIPCCVNLKNFEFNSDKRDSTRNKLGIRGECLVAAYVGKFGDIYYKEEAFQILRKAVSFFGPRFFLIILTPQNKGEVLELMNQHQIPIENVFIDKVKHEEIPSYLSASDFAFSFIKPANCRKYCSPIKDGEYWANGLPILIPDNIGDDSEIIKKNPLSGAVFSLDNSSLNQSFEFIKELISTSSRSERAFEITKLAQQNRDFSIVKLIYNKIFLHSNDF
ncbi:MAG: glycosyltransferase [Chitinophagales bacterium]